MKYCFDLDETICATPSSRKYDEAVPYHKVVNKINELFDQGNEITIFTARGSSSGVDYRDLILRQLSNWGVKFHKLIDKGKPSYDLFVDDKAMSAALWREKEKLQIVGFVASSFDLLHAGHCLYLKEAKSVCDHLIAALQEDPTVDRPHKNKPIQSLFERAGHGTVTIGSIEKFITDTAFEEGWVKPIKIKKDLGQSVGIIGAGPAGLAAAEQLRNYY